MPKVSLPLIRKPFHRYALHAGRWTWYAGTAALFLAAVVLLVVRLWLLPTLADKKGAIEQFLSARSGQVIQIDEIVPYWRLLHPGLRLRGIKVFAPDRSHAAVTLREIRVSLAWSPLLRGRLEADNLTLVQPELSFERRSDGRFKLGGIHAESAETEGGGEKFIAWLFAQKEIVVEDATLRWFDHLAPAPPLLLSHASLRLRNDGTRHRFGLSADFPDRLCIDCSLIADIDGNPLSLEPWAGRVYVMARQVNLGAMPAIVRERLPSSLAGVFDLQLWSEWKAGAIRAVNGQVQVAQLRLPDSAWSKDVGVRNASAEVSWERRGDGWNLDLREFTLGLAAAPWTVGHLQANVAPGRSGLLVQNVSLGELPWVLSHVQVSNPAVEALRELGPQGEVHNLKVDVEGPLSAPTDYRVQADLARLSAAPYRKLPGFHGLDGHVAFSRQRGQADLASAGGTWSFPYMFKTPIRIKRGAATVSWERRADAWRISTDDATVEAKDGHADAKVLVELPFDHTLSPYLNVRAQVRDLNGANAANYYPQNILKEGVRAWLEKSIQGGIVTSGHVIYQGRVRDFPFNEGNGRFEIGAHVTDGTFNYLSGWEPIKKAEVDLLFRGSEMVVTGGGKIHGLNVNQMVTRIPDLRAPEGPMVYISGKVSGPVEQTLKVLRERKTDQPSPFLPAGLQAIGDGLLGLDIVVPVRRAHDFTLSGEYRFFDSALFLPINGMRVSALQGSVGFTRAGLRTGTLQGRFLGGDATLTVTPSPTNPLTAAAIEAQGTLTPTGLTDAVGVLPPGLALVGNVPWRARVGLTAGTPVLTLQSNLQNAESLLPPPLDKARGIPLPVVLNSETSGPNEHVLALAVGDRLFGHFRFARLAQGWQFQQGHVGIGDPSPALGTSPGVWLSLVTSQLDGDRWLRYLKSRPGQGTTGFPDILTRVSADVGGLTLFDRHFDRTTIDLSHSGRTWNGAVQGNQVAGEVHVFPQQTGRSENTVVHLRLAHLIVPERMPTATGVRPVAEQTAGSVSNALPVLLIESQVFQVGKWQLGKLDLWGTPNDLGFQIRQLILMRPEMNLVLHGNWQTQGRQPSTTLDFQLNTTNIGQTLTALGVPDQVAGGKADVTANLRWSGGPSDFTFAHVDGKVSLVAKDGSFIKVHQGAGRLLGLFDVRSLARYLSLDFTSVFGKGYAFDSINGDITVEKGNAYTQSLAVVGPSASLKIAGRTGLASEDFDLEIEISPHLRDNLTVAGGLLGGPVGAGAALLMQRIFKKPIAEGTRMVYIVKGPWQNPVVQRVGRTARQ